jgi:hypothetical protein
MGDLGESRGGEPAALEVDNRLIALQRWHDCLPGLAKQYQENQPFPHIHLKGFLDVAVAKQIGAAFPPPSDAGWTQYRHYNENKIGKSDRATIPPVINQLIDELNSKEFVSWLGGLTGIPHLIPDPALDGGGLHEMGRNGFLNMHVDFSHHHHQPRWHRRCNLILYLNDPWPESWGGAIEFWDADMKACAAKFPPLLNHVVIFNTTDTSFHGIPDPIQCPDGFSRKSIAVYYYTEETAERQSPRSTHYVARPQDGARSAIMIRLDNAALALYSAVKRKFRLSDRLASKLLGLFKWKK